ncbi:MAG TPA: serine/threonine-protein kinase [Desulfatiglandales bacterium]|nr:serine/threonine-protein kinase [Desulfatiglandales bacterium]
MLKLDFNIKDLVAGIIITAIFILFSFISFGAFESLERVLYGIEMRLAISPSMGASKIAIVNIDEKSLDKLGSWPWPRSMIADMITILKDNGARLIGLNIDFSEKEKNQGLEEIKGLYNEIISKTEPETDTWLLNRLDEIEETLDNDNHLLRAVKESGNIILPVTGTLGTYDNELVLTDDNIYLDKNRMKLTGIQLSRKTFVSARDLKTPYYELSMSSHGLGHIDLSPANLMDGRRHLLFFDFRGHIIPSVPFRLALEYLGEKYDELKIEENKGIRLTNSYIPQTEGKMLIRFKGGARSFPYYSFIDILNVKKVPAVFDDKIVLVGYTSEGGPTINTPVDPKMPMVEFVANVIDNMLSGRYLKRPSSMSYIEALFLLLLIMSFSIILPRVSYINRIGIVLVLLLFIILIGVISFLAFNIWFKTVYICLALATLYMQTLISDLISVQRSLKVKSKEFVESNRMLGLSFQSQGLLDLAFEKFRKCPLDASMKDVIYNLGLDYERKRMLNKAIAVYEYIAQNDNKFRDINDRISKLKKVIGAMPAAGPKGKKEEKIVVVEGLEIKPTVGRYEIVREIGQGAMGVVYEARDPKINRLIAIKTIRFSDEFEEDRVKEIRNRFFKEAEIAGRLSHPSIVSIYDVGEDYELTYLAMEFLEGIDLRQHCKKGDLLPLRKVLDIVSEVAMALDYAHSQGVIHRDVKPGNIMLLKNGKVKVTDFGIAKAISSTQTKSGIVLGTPNYMSPEQVNGQKIDGRSDLFSLGVVLFELLTGQVPFHGKNMTNLLYQITQVRHPSARDINPKVPKVCDQIINKALEKDPGSRFQSGTEFAKYLKATIKKMDELRERR